MHYLIICIIITGIIIWQSLIFYHNTKKVLTFKNIFPLNGTNFELAQDDDSTSVLEIKSRHKNYILNVILKYINNYLSNNQGAVSDYHLMKDIIDRNCDSIEEEIHTQIPVPLYLGLVGTMTGILVGVGFLVFNGGLNELLNSANGSGTKGIETLLGGVALAMFSSITGILLTTFASFKARNAKVYLEKNKNTFLGWIQAKLLPNLSNDTSGALVRMTNNLSSFNSTFAQNTHQLRDTLSKVNESYKIQADHMQAINQLKIGDIATANIDVYEKLKNSTNEIGEFAQYLKNTNEYLTTLQGLNQKLDDYEKRTQVIENAGKFFAKNEKWLAENFDIANLEVKGALERFRDRTGDALTNIQESLNVQILNLDKVMQRQQEKLQETLMVTTEIVTESFTKTQQNFELAISDQQTAFKGKLQETSKLVDELKNLTHIKEGIKDFSAATYKQNQKIDELTKEIRALTNAKIEVATFKQEVTFPKWIKILIISGSILFAIACLFFVIPLLITWITNLIIWFI